MSDTSSQQAARGTPGRPSGVGNPGQYRYGVFLRPSPGLGAEALRAYDIVQRQFGFTAACAYPPHTTVVGSIAWTADEGDLRSAVDGALAAATAMPLLNRGLEIIGTAIGYQMEDADPERPLLADLMTNVTDLVAAHRVFPARDFATLHPVPKEAFRPHLTVLGHDGADHPDVVPECFRFLREAGIGAPSEWVGDTIWLMRMHSADWTGRYWETQSWELVESWTLGAEGRQARRLRLA